MADYAQYAGRFEGTTRDGLRDGKGTAAFANKHFSYNGDWSGGEMQGRGTLTLADGSQYDGAFAKGEMTGSGLRRWASGATYSGQFVGGEMHGVGMHISAEGAQYEGEWSENKRQGQGTLTSTSGDRYAGDFSNHRQAGVGTMQYISGEVYHGEWADNVRAGEGKLVRRTRAAPTKALARTRLSATPAIRPCTRSSHVLLDPSPQTYADGATLNGLWSGDKAQGGSSYATNGGYCYEGDFDAGAPLGAATHLAITAYEEPASLLLLGTMTAEASETLIGVEGDEEPLCIAIQIASSQPGDAPTEPTLSGAVPAPEEGGAAMWEGAMRVEVPAGTRRPVVARFELRRGDTVVASGELELNAAYASSPEEASLAASQAGALVCLKLSGREGAPIELRLSYALAPAAAAPDGAEGAASDGEEEAGEVIGVDPAAAEGEGDGVDLGEEPREAPAVSAVAGRPMPPLKLRCLRGRIVEVAPINAETDAVESAAAKAAVPKEAGGKAAAAKEVGAKAAAAKDVGAKAPAAKKVSAKEAAAREAAELAATAAEEANKPKWRLFSAPGEWGRPLSATLSATVPLELGENAPEGAETTRLQTWQLGTVLSGRDGWAVARLVAPDDAPGGSLQLVLKDATPEHVLRRLGLEALEDVTLAVEMKAKPEMVEE